MAMNALNDFYKKIEEVKDKALKKNYTDAEMKKIWLVQENGVGAGWISRYKGTDTDVVFPEEVAGIKILGIANRTGAMPKNYPDLTSVVIPEGYTSIGSMAFEGCTSLKYVSIPKSVKNIRDKAFMNCSSLETVILPPSLEEGQSYLQNSGKWMFRDCTKLKDVYVLNPDIEIGNQAAFRGCDKVIVHMEDDSKLKITNKSKHFAKLTEEEKDFLTSKQMIMPYVETVMIEPELSINAPEEGAVVILNNPDNKFDNYTEVLGLDGTVYGTIDSLGSMVDYLEAIVVSKEYEVQGEFVWKAFDIRISHKG